MDVFWGRTGTEWTAIGAVASCASLVVAVIIAVIVQRGAKRTDSATRRITRSIEELVRRSRRDDLLQQLRTERDGEHLGLLISEARVLSDAHPAERLGLEKAYFTNPSVPLLSYRHELPQGLSDASRTALLKAVIETLPARYDDTSGTPTRFAVDIAHLTRLSIDLGAPTYEIAGFLIERTTRGWVLSDGTIRTILHAEQGYRCPPNMEAASDYLYALQHHAVSPATLVNTVAGVSLAILDFYGLDSRGEPPVNAYTAYITLMQRQLVGIGERTDEDGATISVDHAIAIMVDALGLIAGGDDHLNMRALEALNPILASFGSRRFTSTSTAADHLAAGVRRLVATKAPEPLKVRLREEATRLVPAFADLPD